MFATMDISRVGTFVLLCLGLTVAVVGRVAAYNDTVDVTDLSSVYRRVEFIESWESRHRRPIVLECDDDDPMTRYRWFKNSSSWDIDDIDADRMVRIPGKGTIIFLHPQSKDEGSYRCEVHRSHEGVETLHAIYDIDVEEMIPPPPLKVARGSTVRILSPSGTVVWFKDGTRLNKFNDSDLQVSEDTEDVVIDRVQDGDAARYTCYTSDGRPLAVYDLKVYDPTQVMLLPEELVAAVGTMATFECKIRFDGRGGDSRISWQHDGSNIDFGNTTDAKYHRYDNWRGDQNLYIKNITMDDAGVYLCVVHDWSRESTTSKATLTVVDIPPTPQVVGVKCDGEKKVAVVKWLPVEDNLIGNQSSSYLHYDVQVRAGLDSTLHRVAGNEHELEVKLSPWTNYSLSVRAENPAGYGPFSSASEFTGCLMPPDIPHGNPVDVRAGGTEPDNLRITWEAMPPSEQNGPGFLYRVSYKRSDVADAEWYSEDITEWTTSELVVGEQPTYRPYKVKVEAHNSLGKASVEPVEVDGFSGEDVPQTRIESLVVEEVVDANSAVISWNPVSKESFRGKPRGFRIETWTGNDTDESARRVLFVKPDENTTVIYGLPAFETSYVRVTPFNDKFKGRSSGVMAIVTPEGKPGPVGSLEADPVGTDSLNVSWTEPVNPNGIITGYHLALQKAYGSLLDEPNKSTIPADTTFTLLTALNAKGSYRMTVRAETAAGLGEPSLIESHPSNRAQMFFTLTTKADDKSRCIYYTVRFQKRGESTLTGFTVMARYGNATIFDLESNVAYEIEAYPYC